MKNIFHTIHDALEALGRGAEETQELWHFVLSLPMPDVTAAAYALRDEMEGLIDTFRDTHPMWLEEAWSEEDLIRDAAFDTSHAGRLRLARTLYQIMQAADERTATALRESLARATGGSFRFTGKTPEETEYLERACTIALWFYASLMPSDMEDFLWNDYYLVNGWRLGFDLRQTLAGYLNSSYKQKRIRRETIGHIAALFETNPTVLPSAGKTPTMPVGKWLALAGRKLPARPTKKDIAVWYAAQQGDQLLSETDQAGMAELTLIWSEMKLGLWDKHPDAVEEFPDHFFGYLDAERNGRTPDGGIQSLAGEFEAWYGKEKNGLKARQKILLALLDRVNIEDHLDSLSEVSGWLNKKDAEHPDVDLFYFDETANQFRWNVAAFTLDPTAGLLTPEEAAKISG